MMLLRASLTLPAPVERTEVNSRSSPALCTWVYLAQDAQPPAAARAAVPDPSRLWHDMRQQVLVQERLDLQRAQPSQLRARQRAAAGQRMPA